MRGFRGVIFLLCAIGSAQAGVENEMKNFLFSNSNTNYSSGGAYKSQSRGYYAMPSVYTRNPVIDIKPISYAMPSFRGGCSGIDMFAGSFSHINADQFIALMKAIPSNAMGYAFQLALETISPSIADTMNKMEDVMRSMNLGNLNSCELGKSIVNTGLSKFDAGSEMVCVRKQMENGTASDIAQAKQNCTSGGQRSSTIASASPTQDSAIVDINYAWNAVSKIVDDKEMREFLQTIAGTIIMQKPSDDNVSAQVKVYPSLATNQSTIKALLYGGSMKRYSCDESVKCLNINSASTVNIPASAAFHKKINDVIKSISGKMSSRNQELTTEENQILSTTTFPIMTILRTYQKYHPGEVDSMISDSLSEIIAHEMLGDFIDDMLENTSRISKMNNLQADKTKIEQFEEGIEKARESLKLVEFKHQKKREALLREQKNAETVEGYANKILIGNMYN